MIQKAKFVNIEAPLRISLVLRQSYLDFFTNANSLNNSKIHRLRKIAIYISIYRHAHALPLLVDQPSSIQEMPTYFYVL